MRVLIFLFFFNAAVSFSQEGYSVIYTYDGKLAPITFNGEKRTISGPVDRLVFNDSLSYWYRTQQGVDPLRKKKAFGDKLLHHAIFYNYHSDKYYSVVDWPKGKKPFLVEDSVKADDWIFLPGTKTIFGYTCRSALRVNEKNDSTQVWFTDSIPKPVGPFLYLGFPGLVMEVVDQLSGWHIVATKIQKDFFQITMPKNVMVIPRAQFKSPKE
jgi:GLPGLI family protein